MKNSMNNARKNVTFFLFFSLYGAIFFAMDGEPRISIDPPKDNLISPKKTFTIFDPKKSFESRTPWKDVIPGNIVITPDEKGVVLTRPGQVRYLDFRTFATPPTILLEHRNVKHCPMIDMVAENNGSLLIVSAGNYEHPDEEKYVAEYILFRKNTAPEIRKLKNPIQWIKLSRELLVLGSDHSVTVFNCENNDADLVPLDKDQVLTNIAISPDNTKIICTGSQGRITLLAANKSYDGRMRSYIMKTATADTLVKAISYPNQEELFYLTEGDEAKIINMYDLLENSSVDLSQKKIESYDVESICGGNVRSHAFIELVPSHILATIDQGSHCSIAYSESNDEDNSHHVVVYYTCEETKAIKKSIFTTPVLEKTYKYITETRQSSQKKAELLRLALRGSHLVALGSDGKMYLWTKSQEQVPRATSAPELSTDTIGNKRKKSLSSSRLKSLKISSGSSSSKSKGSSNSKSDSEGDSPQVSHVKKK